MAAARPRIRENGREHGPWAGWCLATLLGVAGLAVFSRWTPPTDPALVACPMLRLAGVPCATCGMTRASAALAKGRVVEATRLHPLAVPLAAELAIAWAAWGAALAGWRRPLSPTTRQRIVLGNVAVLLLAWIARLALG